MIGLHEIKESLLHLVFPHICAGCGSDLLDRKMMICLRCSHSLPTTGFEFYSSNPVEKMLWGRLPLIAATAQYYFTKESLMQQLMHQFKYRNYRELGLMMGRLMGEQLRLCGRFYPDAIIPLPLNQAKEKQRGYNQSVVLCEGIAESMLVPVLDHAILRPSYTETQTKKGRMERWKNIEGKFIVKDPSSIRNRHLLLVDDVITTGATLESCGAELLKVENVSLSIATLCYASH